MNETLAQLKRRKSVRVFADRPIPPEVKKAVIAAAFEAPTAGAMMLYKILDITDQTLKERLAVTCDHQPFIAKAPLILVFVADYQRWYDAWSLAGAEPRRPGPGDLLLSCVDAVIAAQNTVVAAEALGLGSCYIGDIIENCEEVRELLALPEYALPAAMLVFGYPTPQQLERQKPARFAPEYIVGENTYRRLSPEEHLEMHRRWHEASGRAAADVKAELRALCARKYASDFAREMNRSAREYLKPFASDSSERGERGGVRTGEAGGTRD